MPLSSTVLVPDLQYWVSKFILSSALSKYQIDVPVELTESIMQDCGGDKSFIRLLFDDNWPKTQTSYRWLYREHTTRFSWPSTILTRMMVYARSAKLYICDSDDTSVCNVNIFNLQDDDLEMLDRLLEYRVFDSTSVIDDITLADLSTKLSKLIWVFLSAVIKGDYSSYDNTDVWATSTVVLENCYEAYVVEKIFSLVSFKDALMATIYFGDSTSEVLTSAEITSLQSVTDKKDRIYQFSGTGYKYICYPSYLGSSSFVESKTRIAISFQDPYEVNISGVKYLVYRSSNVLGAINIRLT